MSVHMIELDDLADYLSLEVDEPSFPAIAVELTVKWHSAEPEVGIFDNQSELSEIRYCLDGEWYDDAAAFVDALHDHLCDQINDDPQTLERVIRDRIRREQGNIEESPPEE